MGVTIPFRLTDAALESAVKSLARGERETTAQLVAHLAELELRRLHLKAGFSSLYSYCTTVLHLSEGGAYNRSRVRRAVGFRDDGRCAFIARKVDDATRGRSWSSTTWTRMGFSEEPLSRRPSYTIQIS